MSVATKPNTEMSDPERKKDLLKRTLCRGATDDEMELFLMICSKTGLDPFMKQVYPVKRWSAADKKETMTIQTSIDGLRLIAERTGNYSPGKEPSFQYNEDKSVLSATSFVKKRTADGTWHEVAATAYFEEYVQRTKEGKPSNFWSKMPHVMLAKCAEALALRKAFPAEMSGIYTGEEMSQADKPAEETQDFLTEEQCAEIDAYLLKITDKDYLKQLDEYLSNTMKVSSIYDIKQRDYKKVISSLIKKANTIEVDNGSQSVA